MRVAPSQEQRGCGVNTAAVCRAVPLRRGDSTGQTSHGMEQGQDHSPSQPDPLWLQEQKRRLSDELRPWRLLICTTDLTYGLLMGDQ